MLQAYFDESGIHDGADAFILAGFVAGAQRWAEMDRLWRTELKAAGVNDFHAKDLFQPGARYGGLGEDGMINLCNGLMASLAHLPLLPLLYVVPLEAFRHREEWEKRILTGGLLRGSGRWLRSGKPSAPYFLAFPFVFIQAADIVDGAEPIHFFFDRQEQYSGYAQSWFREMAQGSRIAVRLGGLTYTSRLAAAGLQLADLFAHLNYLDQTSGLSHPIQRWCLDRLIQRRRKGGSIMFDAASIDKIMSTIDRDLIERVLGRIGR